MKALDSGSQDAKTRGQLLMLLGVSVAFVFTLTISISQGAGETAAGVPLRQLTMLAVLAAFGALTIASVWYATRGARRIVTATEQELADLRRNLVATEAIIRAEQQALVFWDQGQGPRIVAHNLSSVPGLPEDHGQLLRFGEWVEPKAAAELKTGLDQLFTDGRAFNLLLKTNAGGHLEADGRAAGGRAVLRFRDVAGYKRDLMKILDQHRNLTREIKSSRALLEALPSPVWLKGKANRIEWVNSAYIKAVDAESLSEVIDRQVELLETRQRAAIDASLRRREPYRKRTQLIVGGERRGHDLIVLPLEEAVAGTAIDIGAIETAQGQLDRQVAAYDRTLDKVATAVASFGPDQKLIFFNVAYQGLWELDRAWLAARPSDGDILDRLRQHSRLPAIADYRDWKPKWLSIYKSTTGVEDWWHLPDGRMVHVVAEPRPDGGVTYLYDDATERLALESGFRTLINVQRETLDSLKEGVAVFGPDGRLKLYNSAFAGIWKLSRTTLDAEPHIGEVIRQSRILFDDDRIWSKLLRAVTSVPDERETLDGQMVRPDNSVIDFACSPLPDGAALITYSDVTAAKSYERALIERNDALEAADRLKSQFISHVSYELRTPLTNIIGFSEFLADPRTGTLNQKQHEYLGDINSSSRTLLAIIDDILDLATIDAGTLELKLASVEIRSVVDAAAQALRDRAVRARVALEVSIATDVTSIVADGARLRQVLYNLLSNAVGFSNAGGRVRLECWREADMIAFSVADDGVGIPKEQQARVFERFESRSQGSKHRGAGLGLSIVKSLVGLHGGDMTLSSEPGRGTLITVRFPDRSFNAAYIPPAARRA